MWTPPATFWPLFISCADQHSTRGLRGPCSSPELTVCAAPSCLALYFHCIQASSAFLSSELLLISSRRPPDSFGNPLHCSLETLHVVGWGTHRALLFISSLWDHCPVLFIDLFLKLLFHNCQVLQSLKVGRQPWCLLLHYGRSRTTQVWLQIPHCQWNRSRSHVQVIFVSLVSMPFMI